MVRTENNTREFISLGHVRTEIGTKLMDYEERANTKMHQKLPTHLWP